MADPTYSNKMRQMAWLLGTIRVAARELRDKKNLYQTISCTDGTAPDQVAALAGIAEDAEDNLMDQLADTEFGILNACTETELTKIVQGQLIATSSGILDRDETEKRANVLIEQLQNLGVQVVLQDQQFTPNPRGGRG